MRHRSGYRKLNRKSSEARLALLRGLSCQLFQYKQIETSLERAKELRRVVERLVTRAKDDSVANRRLVRARLASADIVSPVFETAKRFADRNGGYTRIIKLGFTPGDHSRRAIIEFVD